MTGEEDPVAAAAEIKRSQSSLELLSNTAAWKNVVEKNQQGHQQEEQQQQQTRNSESPLARVSPAEQSLKTNSFCAGDSRKDIGMSFEEAAIPHSPSFNQVEHHPGLPLMSDPKPPSSASLISSTSSNNLQSSLPTFTSTWHQQLNPSMHAAFTPPRSNLRPSNAPPSGHYGEPFFATAARSLHDSHPTASNLPGSRQGSSDEGEWSFAAGSIDSTPITVDTCNNRSNKNAEWEALREENQFLKAKLRERDLTIHRLTHERDELQARVDELRQLPTGKISQIPIE